MTFLPPVLLLCLLFIHNSLLPLPSLLNSLLALVPPFHLPPFTPFSFCPLFHPLSFIPLPSSPLNCSWNNTSAKNLVEHLVLCAKQGWNSNKFWLEAIHFMNKTDGWALAIKDTSHLFPNPKIHFLNFQQQPFRVQSAHSTLLLALYPTWNINGTSSNKKRRVPRKRKKHRSLCQTTGAPGKLACECKWREGRVGWLYCGRDCKCVCMSVSIY